VEGVPEEEARGGVTGREIGDGDMEQPERRREGEGPCREVPCPPAVAQAPVGPVAGRLENVGHDRTEEGGEEPHEHRVQRKIQGEVERVGIGEKRESSDDEMRLPAHAGSFPPFEITLHKGFVHGSQVISGTAIHLAIAFEGVPKRRGRTPRERPRIPLFF
jgi:hypothetical protein